MPEQEYIEGEEGTTLVIGPITPTSPIDDYPTAIQRHIKGGFMQFDTLVARDAFPALRREVGQVVYVHETNFLYKLVDDIENGNWEALIIDKYYTHDQGTPSTTWIIPHNLNKYPSVTVVTSAGEEVEGQVEHTDSNNIVLTFSAAFSGLAYLN
jgi:hypothetical protein